MSKNTIVVLDQSSVMKHLIHAAVREQELIGGLLIEIIDVELQERIELIDEVSELRRFIVIHDLRHLPQKGYEYAIVIDEVQEDLRNPSAQQNLLSTKIRSVVGAELGTQVNQQAVLVVAVQEAKGNLLQRAGGLSKGPRAVVFGLQAHTLQPP